MDDILEYCRSEVVDSDDHRVFQNGLGNEVFSLMFKAIRHGPVVDLRYKDSRGLDYLDISLKH